MRPDPSIWARTAGPTEPTPALSGEGRCDVLIVGAGITGLSTALHLAELGVKVCVLDALEPAWGASGRNGGQIIPGIKHDPDAIIARYGKALGEPLLNMVATAADAVFELVERHGIDCQPVRAGWIQPAHSSAALHAVQARAHQWQRRGAPVEILDARQVAERLGTEHYVGGWIDKRAGSVHPLRYTRGLLTAARAHGAAVHGDSPVVSLERSGDRWLARTRNGARLLAEQVLIATNGYTDDLWPKLRRTLIAANSFIIGTDPLPPHLDPDILPGGEVASDSRRLMLYFRRDAQGRFLLGGRGHFSDPSQPADWDHLLRSASLLYPQLRGVDFPFRWAGRIAITRDSVPHLHEPAPNLRVVLGYNGRGAAMATQMGRYLARRIAHGEALPYPVSPITPIPLHGFRRLYIGLAIATFSLCDRLF